MSKRNRGKHKQVKINLIPGKGGDHKAQANSPAQEAQAQAKAKDQEAKAKDQEAQAKAGLLLTTDVNTGQTKATDSKGQVVLTKEDEAKIAKAKALNVKAREAKRHALEIQRQAKDAMEDLNNGGSGVIKAMRQDLEAKIKAQETKAEAMRDSLKTELDNLNSLYTEYKGLTGLDKAAKSNGPGKGKSGVKREANGRFNATVKANGNQVKILVTHKESKSLFETSLYPANGKIKADDWLALRHRFVAFFEEDKRKGKTDKAISAKDYNLVLRAYLSNLKGKVEAIKPIV